MNKLFSTQDLKGALPCRLSYRAFVVPLPMHSSAGYEIAVIYSGNATHVTPSGSTELVEGDVLLVPPGEIHAYRKQDSLSLMSIMVETSFFSLEADGLRSAAHFAELFESGIVKFHLNAMQMFRLKEIIQSLQSELDSQPEGYELGIRALLVQLLLYLVRIYVNPDYTDGGRKNNVSEMIQYMDKNYTREITMQDLMRLGKMSESSVLRAFKRNTGYAPFVYQMRLRLFAAAKALVETDCEISRVAYESGFNDNNYFSRCFKKFLEMTPSEYRRKFSRKNKQNDLSL